MGSLILEIQAAAADDNSSPAMLLRKAKIAATKLKVTPEFITWMNQELDGYKTVNELPPYRRLYGTTEFRHPMYGWRPFIFDKPSTLEYYAFAPCGQPIGSFDEIPKEAAGEAFFFTYDFERKTKLLAVDEIGVVTDARIRLGRASIATILNKVRDAILTWSLELEAAGVLGEGLTFSVVEQEKAGPVTQHIMATNVTLIGTIGDGATVTTTQTATQAPLDLTQLAALLKDLRADIARLPEDEREVAEVNLAMAEAELAKDKPSEGKVRAALKALVPTMANLAVGVAGSAAWDAIKKMAGIG